MDKLGLTNQSINRRRHILYLVEIGALKMTLPNSPNSPTQRYVLTEEGRKLLEWFFGMRNAFIPWAYRSHRASILSSFGAKICVHQLITQDNKNAVVLFDRVFIYLNTATMIAVVKTWGRNSSGKLDQSPKKKRIRLLAIISVTYSKYQDIKTRMGHLSKHSRTLWRQRPISG